MGSNARLTASCSSSARGPLTLELSSLRVADAVLARDRAAETDGELEQVLGSERRAVKLGGVVGVNEEGWCRLPSPAWPQLHV